MESVPDHPVSLACLTVLYHNEPRSIVTMLEAFENSARKGREAGLLTDMVVALGDASASPIFTDEQIKELDERLPEIRVHYTFFDENTGTSRGQNRLARETDSELVLLYNPDVIPDARALWRMAAVLDDKGVGLVEAKQLPVEHPKEYAPGTGYVSWGSGAFSMVPRALFEQLDGFDEQTFFLYCDDVDLSWRIREAGFHVVHQPAAVVFHDKSLSPQGRWQSTSAERYYSAEAALLLAHKWSREDILEDLLERFESSEDENQLRAREEFLRRRDEDRLVPQHDADHKIGTFVSGNYENHRYAL